MPSPNKKGYSLDLYKIKYNDGYIITDAANSNPGFGLWVLKLASKDKNQDSIIMVENQWIMWIIFQLLRKM